MARMNAKICRLDAHQDQAGSWNVLMAATGALAFDIGANIGQSTRVLARGFVTVIALEPCDESFEILAREMPVNVKALPFAAADHTGELILDVAERSISTGQLVTGPGLPMWGERRGTRTVPCITIDELAFDHGPPDFIKIDTEGSEIAVITGAQDALREFRPRLLIEMHRAEHAEPARELLGGYRITELRHGDYVKKGGPVWSNHYWWVCEP